MYRTIAMALAALTLAACSTTGAEIRATGKGFNGTALEAPAEFHTRIVAGADQASVRRELIVTLLARSDRDCEDYLIGMAALRNETSLSIDLTSLTLSAVGGLIDSTRAANILSGGSTAVQSAGQTAEETLFGGRTQALIYTAIRQGRAKQRKDLMDRWARHDFDNWSAASIAAELDRYHLDCGVSYGLTELEAALADIASN